jgi:hypothetical protein
VESGDYQLTEDVTTSDDVTIGNGVNLTIPGDKTLNTSGNLTVNGTLKLEDGASITGGGTVDITNGTLSLPTKGTVTIDAIIKGGSGSGSRMGTHRAGLFHASARTADSSQISVPSGLTLILGENAQLRLNEGAQFTISVESGGTLQNSAGENIWDKDATSSGGLSIAVNKDSKIYWYEESEADDATGNEYIIGSETVSGSAMNVAEDDAPRFALTTGTITLKPGAMIIESDSQVYLNKNYTIPEGYVIQNNGTLTLYAELDGVVEGNGPVKFKGNGKLNGEGVPGEIYHFNPHTGQWTPLK